MKYILNVDDRVRVEDPEKQWYLPAFVNFSGDVNEQNAKNFRQDLRAVESHANNSKQELIPIVIDSRGGDAYSLLSMVEAIKNCKLPVATIVESKAMSAGAILFSCGTEGLRFVGNYASVMIHDLHNITGGKFPDIKASAEHAEYLNKTVYEIMAKNCGHKNTNYFYDLVTELRGADLYLTPQQCIEYNLANEIRIPTFEVNVNINTEFK